MKTKKKQNSFQCIHCGKVITIHKYMGTSHRNHCPFCLWSKHVDEQKAGDRLSQCQGKMEPIGLTFKHKRVDKYGKQKQGELMIVYVCTCCGKININRIAGDDSEETLLALLDHGVLSANISSALKQSEINLLDQKDEELVRRQLFGIPDPMIS